MMIDEISVLNEVLDKYGEHLEMLPDDDYPVYLIHILGKLLAKERNEKEFYKALTYGK